MTWTWDILSHKCWEWVSIPVELPRPQMGWAILSVGSNFWGSQSDTHPVVHIGTVGLLPCLRISQRDIVTEYEMIMIMASYHFYGNRCTERARRGRLRSHPFLELFIFRPFNQHWSMSAVFYIPVPTNGMMVPTDFHIFREVAQPPISGCLFNTLGSCWLQCPPCWRLSQWYPWPLGFIMLYHYIMIFQVLFCVLFFLIFGVGSNTTHHQQQQQQQQQQPCNVSHVLFSFTAFHPGLPFTEWMDSWLLATREADWWPGALEVWGWWSLDWLKGRQSHK